MSSKEREALKLALEALEDENKFIIETGGEDVYRTVITAVQEALAQPEQEPVAVLFQDGSIVKIEDLEFVPEKSGQRVQMLYTTPPQRTWVGLTDDDMGQWIEEEHDVLRWAEAKLKEKNERLEQNT